MNRLDNIRVCGERGHRGFGIVSDTGCHLMFQRLDLRRQHPGELCVHILPQALDGSAFGTLGGQEQTDQIRREDQRCGLMTTPIVPQDHLQACLLVGGKRMHKDLTVDGIQVRQCQKKALPTPWFHGTIPREVLEPVWYPSHRFDPAQGEASSLAGQEANATFIFATEAHWQGSHCWRPRLHRGQFVRDTTWKILLKCHDCFRGFLICDGLGTCSLARRWYRTSRGTGLSASDRP
jgi:hypothetical protein